MKKILFTSAVILTAMLAASCNPQEEQKEEIPAVIEPALTAIANNGVTAGTPNTINVTASGDGATLEIKFFSDKVYLPAGSYSVGTEAGKYTAHYKDKYIDCDVASGSITVSVDEESNYTVSGSLRLGNELGTIVKANVTGLMEFELPTEYYYVQSSADGATVYDIYSLGDTNEHLAKATVFGETGKFTVDGSKKSGTALYGCGAISGSFFKVSTDGYFMALSGTVTVQKRAGKLNFTFDGARDIAFNNCEKKTSVNEVINKPTELGTLTCKYFIVESEIAKGAYEFTEKLFFGNGNEFISITLLLSKTTITGENLHPMIQPYENYKEENVDNYAIGPACYYMIDGKPVQASMAGDVYGMVNASYEAAGIGFALPLTASYILPDDLFNYYRSTFDPAADPMMAPYSLLGTLVQ